MNEALGNKSATQPVIVMDTLEDAKQSSKVVVFEDLARDVEKRS